MMPRAVAAEYRHVDADAGAPITFSPLAFSRSLAVTLVAERMARPIEAGRSLRPSLSLSLPKFRLEVDGYAAVLENLNGRRAKAQSEIRTRGLMGLSFGQRIQRRCGEKGEGFFRARSARSHAVGLQERHADIVPAVKFSMMAARRP